MRVDGAVGKFVEIYFLVGSMSVSGVVTKVFVAVVRF